MSNEFRPLVQVLRELKSLAHKRSSGFAYVVTEDNHSCIVRLHQGQVQEVVYRMLRNEEAVQRLSMVAAAKMRFESSGIAALPSGRAPLAESSVEWLLGGFEHDLGGQQYQYAPAAVPSPAPGAASAGAPAVEAVVVNPHVRQALEQIALNYLGPIAGMLCQEAFDAAGGDPQRAIVQLAGQLYSQQEAQRFSEEARKALAALR
ncbi:hypothetical protein [Lysobacter enzymogenes]|jgi:hypothetical protein|uniref:hypothetical protein n=1 Tax=Lysobacter enzymogenes TaxID=69 RepID=UPI00089D4EC6|nr:hypothetical protein [Lysobacter enzymogenes]SDX56315.1 hypothetical protein SAMN05421681_106131 [Lysobacter enzymogenes]